MWGRASPLSYYLVAFVAVLLYRVLVHHPLTLPRHSRTIPQDIKIAVSLRDGGKCRRCGSTSDLQFDHAIFGSIPGTMNALSLQRWQEIKNRFLKVYSEDPAVTDALDALDFGGTLSTPTQPNGKRPARISSDSVPNELGELFGIASRTRNVILYGAPGTGKTWVANHFAHYYLLHHNA